MKYLFLAILLSYNLITYFKEKGEIDPYITTFAYVLRVLEMESMQECGMPPEQVICSATKINSEILGLENALGTVEEGKLADLLVINQDPTEDVRVFQNDDIIEYIFMGGELVVDHGRMIL